MLKYTLIKLLEMLQNDNQASSNFNTCNAPYYVIPQSLEKDLQAEPKVVPAAILRMMSQTD